jgi:transcription elongation GreA/GreB family factor
LHKIILRDLPPMSVAFRRESDEEHLEPRFELPIPAGPNLVTKRGLEMIEERVATFEQELEGVADEEARKPLLRDLRYWRQRLGSAQLAPTPTGEVVAIGTVVTIVQEGRERVLRIVGHDESDPASGRIAFVAPLARALLDAELGEDIELPGGSVATLKSIEVARD